MPVDYPIQVQAIRSKGRAVRLFMAVPLALAAAIDLEPGEQVQWPLRDRHELNLVRQPRAQPKRRRRR
jgi:hypothetical protein